jgi:valyl-tRNA synthetase
MKRFHARNEVVKQLKEKGLFIDAKDNAMTIPICACVTSSSVDLISNET